MLHPWGPRPSPCGGGEGGGGSGALTQDTHPPPHPHPPPVTGPYCAALQLHTHRLLLSFLSRRISAETGPLPAVSHCFVFCWLFAPGWIQMLRVGDQTSPPRGGSVTWGQSVCPPALSSRLELTLFLFGFKKKHFNFSGSAVPKAPAPPPLHTCLLSRPSAEHS